MSVVVVRQPVESVVVVRSINPVVQIVTAVRGPIGLTGVQGPEGPAGTAPQSYVHIQGLPSSIWLVEHNLGYRPGGVHVTNSAGDDVEGDVHHDNLNQLTINFGAPFSGSAYMS